MTAIRFTRPKTRAWLIRPLAGELLRRGLQRARRVPCERRRMDGGRSRARQHPMGDRGGPGCPRVGSLLRDHGPAILRGRRLRGGNAPRIRLARLPPERRFRRAPHARRPDPLRRRNRDRIRRSLGPRSLGSRPRDGRLDGPRPRRGGLHADHDLGIGRPAPGLEEARARRRDHPRPPPRSPR